jgi:RND family efflux transporter MFP subunit
MADETRFQTLARLNPGALWSGVALTTCAAVMSASSFAPAEAQASSTARPTLDTPHAVTPVSYAAATQNASNREPAYRAPPPAAMPSAASRAQRQLVGCLIGPERVADIGTAVTGVVARMLVDRGDSVRKGQPLVVLESEVEQAGLKAAQARSAIEADVHAAEANLAMAQQKHKRMAGLVDEGFVTPQAVEQALAERDVAAQKLVQAKAQRVVQAQEAGVVRAQIGQRTLQAPFGGVVVERFLNAGERADDKPLLRVAQLDPLRVELVMPATRWGSVAGGDAIAIVPELPGAASLLARVTHVDKIIDAASNTFRVRLSLPNPGNKVPAGARCKVDSPAEAAASPSASPAAVSSPKAPGVLPASLQPPHNMPAHPRLKITV